jgi:hypothetical protein
MQSLLTDVKHLKKDDDFYGGNKPMIFDKEQVSITSHSDHFIPNIKIMTYFDSYQYLGKTLNNKEKLFQYLDKTDIQKKEMLITLLKKSKINYQTKLSDVDKEIIHYYYFQSHDDYLKNKDMFNKQYQTLEDYFGYYI